MASYNAFNDAIYDLRDTLQILISDELGLYTSIKEMRLISFSELSSHYERLVWQYEACNGLFIKLIQCLEEGSDALNSAEYNEDYVAAYIYHDFLATEGEILSALREAVRLYQECGAVSALAGWCNLLDGQRYALLETEKGLRELEDRFYASRMTCVYAPPEMLGTNLPETNDEANYPSHFAVSSENENSPLKGLLR